MIQKLKILIVEDSPSFALELELLVQKIGYNVLQCVDNAEEALLITEREKPDLILLDIQLKGKMSGIEFSKTIINLNIPIIFITSYTDEEHYNCAKGSTMIAYLIKPMSSFLLKVAIETALTNVFKRNTKNHLGAFRQNYLFFKKKGVYHRVHVNNILYAKSADNYCEIFTVNKDRFHIRISISKLLGELFSKEKFIRIHRQYIVQLNKIITVDFNKNHVQLDSKVLPLSKTYKDQLYQVMKIVS